MSRDQEVPRDVGILTEDAGCLPAIVLSPGNRNLMRNKVNIW